jgi:hypothetical protein
VSKAYIHTCWRCEKESVPINGMLCPKCCDEASKPLKEEETKPGFDPISDRDVMAPNLDLFVWAPAMVHKRWFDGPWTTWMIPFKGTAIWLRAEHGSRIYSHRFCPAGEVHARRELKKLADFFSLEGFIP